MINVLKIPAVKAELAAGSIGLFNNILAFGSYNGFMLRRFPCLDEVYSNHTLLPSGLSVNGINIFANYLVIHTNLKELSFDKPRDWDGHLKKMSLTTFEEEQQYKLGPGNWSLVKSGKDRGRVVLWDSTEGQGVISLSSDLNSVLWKTKSEPLIRVDYSQTNELLAVTCGREIVSIDKESGELNKIEIPENNFHWSAVNKVGEHLILGGFTDDKKSYVIAVNREDEFKIKKIPIKDIFDKKTIEKAMADEEDCGADIFEVSNILVFCDSMLLVSFGGNGVSIGTDGGTSVAVIDLMTLSIRSSIVVDELDSCSGLIEVESGKFLLNCCDSNYIIDLSHK